MKKLLFLILAAILFAGCSSDKDDPLEDWKGDSPEMNPVAGEWQVLYVNMQMRKDPMVYKFTSDRKWFITETISKATQEPVYSGNGNPYQINESQILKGHVIHTYEMKHSKSLIIYSPGQIYELIPFEKGSGEVPTPQD